MSFMIAERRITLNYRRRNTDPDALGRAINECQYMIGGSSEFFELLRNLDRELPGHRGFYQLTVILDKHKRHAEALALCRQA